MRPLRLELQAFGSYPGREVIDFATLARRGLFAVTGPTGSGKSTIFDAMVFALYGVLPGARSGGESECRSQHAALDVETEVRFDVEVGGTVYRITRKPAQERRAKRGSGTAQQAAEASLVRVVDGSIEPLATQMRSVTAACQEILGLDASQFQRVVLLPQGAFSAFLLAKEVDREELLRPLFGGHVYARATEWLKGEANRLRELVEGVDAQVQHHLRNAADSLATVVLHWGDEPLAVDELLAAGGAAMQAQIDRMLPAETRQRQVVVAAQERARLAGEAAATAESAAALFDSADRARRELNEYLEQREAIHADEARVTASRRARPVVVAADRVDRARNTVTVAQGHLDRLVGEVTSLFGALRRMLPELTAPALSAAIQQADHDVRAHQQLLATLAVAVQAHQAAQAATAAAGAALAAATASAVAGRAEAGRVDDEVTQLAPVAAGLDARHLEVERANRALADRKRLDEAHHRRELAATRSETARHDYESIMQRFVATQAPRLAGELRDGEPCPVCGSTEHPAPARAEGDEAVGHEMVDAARQAWAVAQRDLTSAETEIDALQVSLGDAAATEIAVLESVAAAASKALREAELATTRLVAAQEQQAQLRVMVTALENDESQRRTDAAIAEAEFAARADDVAVATAACAHIDRRTLAQDEVAVGALRDLVPSLDAVFGGVVAARAALEQSERALADEVAASGYASRNAAADACLDADIEHRMSEQVTAWKEAVTRLETALQAYEAQGIPPERPQFEALREQATHLDQQARELAAAHTTTSDALTSAQGSLREAHRVGEESAHERAQHDVARRVFRTCNGEAGMRVKLERWVLARELERVTAAANVHLARMSNGRYRLERDASQGGLRLEVHDVHTGMSRATGSLSGGEQFQASLSLALGLADVVSLGGSSAGKQFDALFVDEGFGTLDQDVLAVAIDALEQIHAGGRMVGVITHVEEMKQRLHCGIEVIRLPDDRGSTLRVHP